MNSLFLNLICISCLIESYYTLQCFDSCFSTQVGDCQESGVCADRCGDSTSTGNTGFEEAFPGFVVTECETECLWGEFIFNRSGNIFFTLAVPFGCKENYSPQRVSQNILSNVQFSQGVNLFSCTGDLCNQPSEDFDCTLENALDYTKNFDEGSPCFLTSNSIQSLQIHPFRVISENGRVQNNVNHLNRCVELSQIQIDNLSFQRFDSQNITQELTFMICDICRSTGECSVDDEFFPEVVTTGESEITQPPTINEESEEEIVDEENSIFLVAILLSCFTVLLLLNLIFWYRKNKRAKELKNISQNQLAVAEIVEDQRRSVQVVPVATQMPIWSVGEGNQHNIIDDLENFEGSDEDNSLEQEKIEIENALHRDLDYHSLFGVGKSTSVDSDVERRI
eukprot:snap_masked-scaffold_3-processed-gene-20.17-mRNA-1 protein AED:1.00 eAED:1.00 QI:0/0/0/0/1/1/2/0/394